tara:strand:+ start:1534 stop:1731 length:198 start_codon:yes stop_codon:yes gene_type:complete
MIDFGKDLDNRLKALSDKKQRSKRFLIKEALKLYLDIEEDKAKNKNKNKNKNKDKDKDKDKGKGK